MALRTSKLSKNCASRGLVDPFRRAARAEKDPPGLQGGGGRLPPPSPPWLRAWPEAWCPVVLGPEDWCPAVLGPEAWCPAVMVAGGLVPGSVGRRRRVGCRQQLLSCGSGHQRQSNRPNGQWYFEGVRQESTRRGVIFRIRGDVVEVWRDVWSVLRQHEVFVNYCCNLSENALPCQVGCVLVSGIS